MRYKVELVPSDDGFAVSCLDLPGCTSQGNSEEEAILNIREAIEKYVATVEERKSAAKVRFIDVPTAVTTEARLKGDVKRVPFVITPIMNSPFPAEWTSHKVEELLTILEGPDHR